MKMTCGLFVLSNPAPEMTETSPNCIDVRGQVETVAEDILAIDNDTCADSLQFLELVHVISYRFKNRLNTRTPSCDVSAVTLSVAIVERVGWVNFN